MKKPLEVASTKKTMDTCCFSIFIL